MSNPAIVGPIAPYSNVPMQPENYKPRQYYIDDIALGKTTTITTATDHDYVIGQQVRLIIPFFSGCRQLNETFGFVISIPASDEIEVAIDSSLNVDAFVVTTNAQQPQVLAIGDIANGYISTTAQRIPSVSIPGSFINIS